MTKVSDNKEMTKDIVKRLVQGQSQEKIAEVHGIHRSTVFRLKTREDVRKMIEEESKRYLELLPAANRISKNIIEQAERESNKLQQDDATPNKYILNLATKHCENLQRATGILPSHTIGQQVNMILVDNRQQVLSPALEGILRDQAQATEVDITPENDNEPGS
jgi:hypothetical protein